jgi:ribosomal protein S10
MNVQTLTSPKRMMKMYKSTKKTEKNKENYEIYITTRMIKTYKGSDKHEVVSKIRYEG